MVKYPHYNPPNDQWDLLIQESMLGFQEPYLFKRGEECFYIAHVVVVKSGMSAEFTGQMAMGACEVVKAIENGWAYIIKPDGQPKGRIPQYDLLKEEAYVRYFGSLNYGTA